MSLVRSDLELHSGANSDLPGSLSYSSSAGNPDSSATRFEIQSAVILLRARRSTCILNAFYAVPGVEGTGVGADAGLDETRRPVGIGFWIGNFAAA